MIPIKTVGVSSDTFKLAEQALPVAHVDAVVAAADLLLDLSLQRLQLRARLAFEYLRGHKKHHKLT